MKKATLIILFLLIYAQSRSQSTFIPLEIPDSLFALCEEIKNVDVVMTQYTGKAAKVSEQWKRFEKLQETASENDLFKLTNHPSAVVRAYAFWALENQHSGLIGSVLRKNENDTAQVEYMEGCIRSRPVLIDFMVYKVSKASLSKFNAKDKKLYKSLLKRARKRTPGKGM